MFKNPETIKFVVGIIIIGLVILIFKFFRKALNNRKLKDFDIRVDLNDISLSEQQKEIKKKYGSPLEIRHQESIDNLIRLSIDS